MYSNDVCQITINREYQANTLGLKTCEELAEIALMCEDSKEMRSVILTAVGDKIFSGCGGISEFVEQGENLSAHTKRMTRAIFSIIVSANA